MDQKLQIQEAEVDALLKTLNEAAEKSGYHLNPDQEFTRELVKSLLINRKRYGYQACPCRLASGEKNSDLDIICPCDYRDPDLDDYGACYCALYVSERILKEEQEVQPIPERRNKSTEEKKSSEETVNNISDSLKYPVWRCKVCGYLCARDNPPGVCPICKAERERFEKFI